MENWHNRVAVGFSPLPQDIACGCAPSVSQRLLETSTYCTRSPAKEMLFILEVIRKRVGRCRCGGIYYSNWP